MKMKTGDLPCFGYGLSRAKNFTSNGHAQQLYELIIFRKALLMDQKTIACDSRNFVSYKFAYIAPVMLLMQVFLAVVGACGSIWNVINTAPSISVCIYSSMFIWNVINTAPSIFVCIYSSMFKNLLSLD
ncbi:uncharacterized protein LOC141721756 isoform X3 [Apium graveolens]|uniref:uncharacterized protein LOC141721756 isoform X3 n=1 Tax=Apium graveolens TaxID=4045 RepID=UPI003D793362